MCILVRANPFEDAKTDSNRFIETAFKEAFEIFDKDGDGIVSIADMVKLIKSSGLSYKGDNIRKKIKKA